MFTIQKTNSHSVSRLSSPVDTSRHQTAQPDGDPGYVYISGGLWLKWVEVGRRCGAAIIPTGNHPLKDLGKLCTTKVHKDYFSALQLFELFSKKSPKQKHTTVYIAITIAQTCLWHSIIFTQSYNFSTLQPISMGPKSEWECGVSAPSVWEGKQRELSASTNSRPGVYVRFELFAYTKIIRECAVHVVLASFVYIRNRCWKKGLHKVVSSNVKSTSFFWAGGGGRGKIT